MNRQSGLHKAESSMGQINESASHTYPLKQPLEMTLMRVTLKEGLHFERRCEKDQRTVNM